MSLTRQDLHRVTSPQRVIGGRFIIYGCEGRLHPCASIGLRLQLLAGDHDHRQGVFGYRRTHSLTESATPASQMRSAGLAGNAPCAACTQNRHEWGRPRALQHKKVNTAIITVASGTPATLIVKIRQ